MSLAVTIFLLVLLAEAVSWVGKTVLQEFFCAIYLKLFCSKLCARQGNIKSTILSTKAELLATSAQDQFAKWAKLRRSLDKGLQDLDKTNSEVSTIKTSFSRKFSVALWWMTTGAQFVVGWWYRKSAVFYLPEGWFDPFTWWFALFSAPKGSISCGVWQMACRRVLQVAERVVRDLNSTSSTTPAQRDKEAPVSQDKDKDS